MNKESRNRNYSQQGNFKERSFDEGDCEMSLIESVQSNKEFSIPKTIPLLKDKDLELLKTLHFDKKCSIEILKSVFETTEEVIKESIKFIENE